MGIETARRVQDQVREGLAELIRLVNDRGHSDLRMCARC